MVIIVINSSPQGSHCILLICAAKCQEVTPIQSLLMQPNLFPEQRNVNRELMAMRHQLKFNLLVDVCNVWLAVYC